jgi:hypothetical protein
MELIDAIYTDKKEKKKSNERNWIDEQSPSINIQRLYLTLAMFTQNAFGYKRGLKITKG